MQRYFVKPKQICGDFISITNNNDIYHITKVMRYRVGEKVICVDGMGHDYVVEITRIDQAAIDLKILQVMPSQGEPSFHITLAQSIPKGERWEWVLQKGTELGVIRFIPFFSERTIVKIPKEKIEKKRARWQRIVKEAAEQSWRGIIPQVDPPISWNQLLQQIEQENHAWIAYEREGESLKQCLQDLGESNKLLLIIGPEGGFSEREIEESVKSGATPITLGPRILRTETATLVALSAILFANDQLGGEQG